MAQGKGSAQGQGQREIRPSIVEDDLTVLPGVNMEIAEALCAAGLGTLEGVGAASNETLLAVPGIGPATLARMRDYFRG